MEKDLGFNSEQVVVLQMRGDIDDNIEAVKTEMLRDPNVMAATASWGVPGSWSAGDGVRQPGSDTEWPVRILVADYDFIVTYQMRMAAGRAFSRDFPSDAAHGFILNETAAHDLGWTPEEAVGKDLNWNEWGVDSVRTGSVIGVVDDFHSATLYEEIEPLVMLMQTDAAGQLSLRIAASDVSETLKHIEATYKNWAPAWPFDFEFLEDDLTEEYTAEQKLSTLITVFSGLAILIACLGLFGLALFTAQRRTREIGVRKALGATSRNIVVLLSSELVRLVVISFVIGIPVAWYALSQWLGHFAYHIDFGFGVFTVAGFVVLSIAMLTVGYQAVRAASTDPAKSLRYE
jgi:putative ABC transport system permease protein